MKDPAVAVVVIHFFPFIYLFRFSFDKYEMTHSLKIENDKIKWFEHFPINCLIELKMKFDLFFECSRQAPPTTTKKQFFDRYLCCKPFFFCFCLKYSAIEHIDLVIFYDNVRLYFTFLFAAALFTFFSALKGYSPTSFFPHFIHNGVMVSVFLFKFDDKK